MTILCPHTWQMTGHNISDAMILYDTRGLEDACGFLNNSKDSKYALLLAEGKAQEDCPLNIPDDTWLPLWIWWALEWVWWALEWVWWITVGLLFFLFVQNKKRSRDWWPEGGMDYLSHWFFALCAFLVLVRGCNILYHIVNWVLGVAYSCLSWLFSLSSNQKSSGCTKSGFADRKVNPSMSSVFDISLHRGMSMALRRLLPNPANRETASGTSPHGIQVKPNTLWCIDLEKLSELTFRAPTATRRGRLY
jgi:hypothetical protein